MKSEVTVLLICVLFSKAQSLKCQQCVTGLPGSSGTSCEQTSCPDQCLTATTSVYMGATKLSDVSMKACSMPDMCVSGSMNLGMMKVINNAKCCSTDLCNTETLPALPKQAPNGKKCYTCDATDCSKTVSCEGNEDRCISASVQQAGNTVSMKGCVSRIFCAASGTSSAVVGMSSVNCCEGNLCNGAAESFTLSFLLMIIPLLSSILFY